LSQNYGVATTLHTPLLQLIGNEIKKILC